MKKDNLNQGYLKQLLRAQMLIKKQWGVNGEIKFKKLKDTINSEIESYRGRSNSEIEAYITLSFKEMAWGNDRIKKWFEGKTNPFRKEIQLDNPDYSSILLADFFLFKMMYELTQAGISYKDSMEIITATFVAKWIKI